MEVEVKKSEDESAMLRYALGYQAGWYAAIDAAIKEAEALTGDKGTASSGLSRTFRTLAKLRKLREAIRG